MSKHYVFEHVIRDANSFIHKYVEWAKTMTDAPYEYHEAHAISMLGVASHGLLIEESHNPGGQPLNFYMLMLGSSALMRKSTCMRLADNILYNGLGGGYGQSNDFTPEGLMEAMQRHDGRSMVVHMDEFTSLLDRLMKQNMTGLKPLILKFLNSRSHTYTRTSKGTVKKKEVDEVVVKNAHLNIVGNVTPSISQRLNDEDIEDGFLGRFLIVAPMRKPVSKQFEPPNAKQMAQAAELIEMLDRIATACQNCREYALNNNRRTVRFDMEASALLWNYQQQIEGMEKKVGLSQFIVIQRIPEYSVKLSCIIALSRYDLTKLMNGPLIVTAEDVKLGIKIADKYKNMALDFCKGIDINPEETNVRKILHQLSEEKDNRMARSAIMRKFHLQKWEVDRLESTMVSREQIMSRPEKVEGAIKPKTYWTLLNGYKKTPTPPPPGPGGQNQTAGDGAEES